MASKHVILVAGLGETSADRPKNVPPIPFYQICNNRIELLRKKDPTLIFTLFDVTSGFVTQSKLKNDGTRIVRKISSPLPVIQLQMQTMTLRRKTDVKSTGSTNRKITM